MWGGDVVSVCEQVPLATASTRPPHYRASAVLPINAELRMQSYKCPFATHLLPLRVVVAQRRNVDQAVQPQHVRLAARCELGGQLLRVRDLVRRQRLRRD